VVDYYDDKDGKEHRLEIATKGAKVEAYIVTLPLKLDPYEVKHPHQLFHTIGGYALFDKQPKVQPIPVSDPRWKPPKPMKPMVEGQERKLVDEPVFCPPLLFERGEQ
jgi:hypothetical protein